MQTNDGLAGSTARAALTQVEVGRSAAARRVRTPWWFHPLLGAALAVMLAALSLRGPAVAVVLFLALVAQVALYSLYRRLTGLWIDTWHVEGMRQVTTAATAACVALLACGIGLERAEVRGAAAVPGVVLGVAYVVYWRRVKRRLVTLWTPAP